MVEAQPSRSAHCRNSKLSQRVKDALEIIRLKIYGQKPKSFVTNCWDNS